MKCQLSLNVKEMLSELPWKIRVKVDEGVEGYPKFKGWQSDHFKHLWQAEIVDVLAVQVDNARVDQETLLKDVILDDFR